LQNEAKFLQASYISIGWHFVLPIHKNEANFCSSESPAGLQAFAKTKPPTSAFRLRQDIEGIRLGQWLFSQKRSQLRGSKKRTHFLIDTSRRQDRQRYC
jgi:hypothetical protein